MFKTHDHFVSNYSEIKICLKDMLVKINPPESIETIVLTTKEGIEQKMVSMTINLNNNDEAEDYAFCVSYFDEALDKLDSPIDKLIKILPTVIHSNKLYQNLSGDVYANLTFLDFAQITGILRYITRKTED